jgi:hypothetical protein
LDLLVNPPLQGPVVRVVTRHIHVQTDLTEKSGGTTVEEYDGAGHLITATSYKTDGLLCSRTAMRYDTDGRLCERTYQNPDGSTITHQVDPASECRKKKAPRVDRFTVPSSSGGFGYGIDGLDVYLSASPGQRIAVHYDEAGRATQVMVRSRFGLPSGRRFFAYDEAGRMTRFVEYGGLGAGGWSAEVSPGKIRRALMRHSAPLMLSIARVMVFLHTARYLLRRRNFAELWRSVRFGTPLSEMLRVYDEAGRVIEERLLFCGGMLETVISSRHDARGLLVERLTSESGKSNSHERFMREFDHQGNWIKEICTRTPGSRCGPAGCEPMDHSTAITYREIEYAADA